MTKPLQVSILGATGSIGASTLDVVARHPERFEVFGVSGFTRISDLVDICIQVRPRMVALKDEAARAQWLELYKQRAPGASLPQAEVGEAGLKMLAGAPEVDQVMAAIVGAAGLQSTLAAADAGKTILLANKETLVMGGGLFIERARAGGATVIPIDSEHNAIFQCLNPSALNCLPVTPQGVTRVVLTASGGPFRTWSREMMEQATPEQACAHPKWSMGRKISVDSATLMNKGLEVIEAHYLFGLGAEQLEVLVHPQSIVHSMVEYADGSTLAQLGNPDMRTPIAQAMGFPMRLESGVGRLDLAKHGRLEFEAPDLERFGCLSLAFEAMAAGGASACILNAANEVAVAMFLDRQICFGDIERLNRRVCDDLWPRYALKRVNCFEDLLEIDDISRTLAREVAKEWTA